jgi:hypothetical protein
MDSAKPPATTDRVSNEERLATGNDLCEVCKKPLELSRDRCHYVCYAGLDHGRLVPRSVIDKIRRVRRNQEKYDARQAEIDAKRAARRAAIAKDAERRAEVQERKAMQLRVLGYHRMTRRTEPPLTFSCYHKPLYDGEDGKQYMEKAVIDYPGKRKTKNGEVLGYRFGAFARSWVAGVYGAMPVVKPKKAAKAKKAGKTKKAKP